MDAVAFFFLPHFRSMGGAAGKELYGDVEGGRSGAEGHLGRFMRSKEGGGEGGRRRSSFRIYQSLAVPFIRRNPIPVPLPFKDSAGMEEER